LGRLLDGVDDLPDVGLLERLDARVEREDLVIDDRGDPDLVDVVVGAERMALEVVRRRAEVQAEAVEEHHGDVDALVARGGDAVAEAAEVRLVEPGEVEPRLAVRCRSGPGSRPRLRRHAEVESGSGGKGFEVLPAPEPDEVVPVLLQEIEVGAVVVALRHLGARRAGAETVVEAVPDVRTGQVDHLPVGAVARRDGEIAWVGRRDHEGPSRGASLLGLALVVSHVPVPPFGEPLARLRGWESPPTRNSSLQARIHCAG
jgi:hypothetical protein